MTSTPANLEGQIRELLAAGNKIAAIKLYREATRSSLKDAKDAVEAFVTGSPLNLNAPAQVSEPEPFLEGQIKRLLTERKKIEAVRLYREAHHCGLKDAKDAVDAIEVALRQEQKLRKSAYTPLISNDPFAKKEIGNRRRFILSLALILVAIGVFVFFFFFQSGF